MHLFTEFICNDFLLLLILNITVSAKFTNLPWCILVVYQVAVLGISHLTLQKKRLPLYIFPENEDLKTKLDQSYSTQKLEPYNFTLSLCKAF